MSFTKAIYRYTFFQGINLNCRIFLSKVPFKYERYEVNIIT